MSNAQLLIDPGQDKWISLLVSTQLWASTASSWYQLEVMWWQRCFFSTVFWWHCTYPIWHLKMTAHNRKGFHSIDLQALVDYDYRFINVNFGWLGILHDARILANSTAFAHGEAGTLIPNCAISWWSTCPSSHPRWPSLSIMVVETISRHGIVS